MECEAGTICLRNLYLIRSGEPGYYLTGPSIETKEIGWDYGKQCGLATASIPMKPV